MSETDHDTDSLAAVYVSTPSCSVINVISQINAARIFAQQAGIELVGEYIDLRESPAQLVQVIGDAIANDPQFRKMLVFGLECMHQHVETTNGCRERLAANRIKIITVDESRVDNPSKPLGKPSTANTPNGLQTVHDLVGEGRSWLLMVRPGDRGWEYRNRRSDNL